MARPIALLVVLAACNGGFTPIGTDIPSDEADSDTDADSDADSDADADADTDADADADTDADPNNNPPSADAGIDQDSLAGQAITLNASGSSDPDGDTLTYFWTMDSSPAGWSGNIINPDRVSAQFFADTPGTYEAQVTVSDGEYSSSDSVFINVDEPNDQPVANAGFDENVDQGDPVSLDGSGSYDPDGDPLTYVWTIVNKPTASNAILNGATTATPSFTADAVGVFSIELIVNDGATSSNADVVRITAASAGGFDTGGSGSGDCLSCVAANSRLHSGSAAAIPGMLLLPFFFVLARRRTW